MNDLKFAFRQLLKTPGFTAVAVMSLALGIGAATSIFSLVNGILLSSLPVPNPQELRILNWSGADFRAGYDGDMIDDGAGRRRGNAFPLALFRELRLQCADQADIFGYVPLEGVAARARHDAVSAEGLMVTDNFFSGLRVRSLLGRVLGAQEEKGGTAPVVVISYRWWEQQFGLDPAALGESVLLNGHSFTLIGVLPRDFPGVRPGTETDFYIPLTGGDPNRWRMPLMARLKPGANNTRFQAALDVVFRRATEKVMKDSRVLVTDGRAGPDLNRREYRKPLMLLLTVVGMVLLIACANLAGLSLARGAARRHEFAIRAALGSGRWRLVRQTLTESLVLALAGCGLGVVISLWGKQALSRLLSGTAQGLHYDDALDLRVLCFALTVSIFTAILSGLLPAVRAGAADPKAGLKNKASLGTHRLRAGRGLVAAQIALSLLLLVGAGLYVRTLINLARIDPGFPTENLLLFKLNPGDAGYPDEKTTEFFARAQDSLTAIPGVRSVALAQFPLLSGESWVSSFTIPSRPSPNGEYLAHMLTISETFLTTMGVPLLDGRDLRPADTGDAPKAVIVNEAFAHKFFPGEPAVGQILKRNNADWHIVGVCRDIKYSDVKAEAPPTLYLSFRQNAAHSAFFALRTALPPVGVAAAARRIVAALDPNIPVTDLATQAQIRDGMNSQQRLFAVLCTLLAALAVMLSCIGLYGLMAYHVSRRTGEIGIRIALGATRRLIAGPILREAFALGAFGVAVGALLATVLSKFIKSQLYGIQPNDTLTIVTASLGLILLALAAAWLPARRATRVDPITALRCE
jgi:predicted permease